MIHSKRVAVLLGVVAFCCTLLYLRSMYTNPSWRTMPQVVGLGDLVDDETVNEDGELPSKYSQATGAMDVASSMFQPGEAKLMGYNYTRNLVVAKTMDEAADWIANEDLGGVVPMVYVVDDDNAVLKVPKNKGHEVMVYLTYIIEHYDSLPDVSIFMHAHQFAWHQNDLLEHNAAEMVRRLNSERVQREGYMNLRCHWMPGCPDWMHPGTVEEDVNKQEETVMAEAWAELFPDRPIPEVLAQPCCAQFALSRARIRAVSRERYEFYRAWMLRTPLDDRISGRVWEYLWQVVFTGEATFCPNQWACYCDGYGVCFKDEKEFDYWFELRYNQHMLEVELSEWQEKADSIEKYRGQGMWIGIESGEIQVPELGRDIFLKAEIEKLGIFMEDGRQKAIERGNDPRFRAFSSGRNWDPEQGF